MNSAFHLKSQRKSTTAGILCISSVSGFVRQKHTLFDFFNLKPNDNHVIFGPNLTTTGMASGMRIDGASSPCPPSTGPIMGGDIDSFQAEIENLRKKLEEEKKKHNDLTR